MKKQFNVKLDNLESFDNNKFSLKKVYENSSIDKGFEEIYNLFMQKCKANNENPSEKNFEKFIKEEI